MRRWPGARIFPILAIGGLVACCTGAMQHNAFSSPDVGRLIGERLAGLPPLPNPQLQGAIDRVITVAPSVNDSATIERALAMARSRRAVAPGAITILFRPGIYRLDRTLRLTEADSGAPESPLRLQGDPAGEVFFTGSAPLARAPVPAALTNLIAPALRDKVQGFSVPPGSRPDPAFPSRASQPDVAHPTLIVSQGDKWLTRAVWPARGYVRQKVYSPQPGPTVAPVAALPAELSARLAAEPALSAAGYWTHDWFYEERPVARIDAAASRLHVGPLTSRYPEGAAIRFRILNGFSLIDAPGDFAYSDGRLVALPFAADVAIEAARLDTVVAIAGAHDIILAGIGIRGARGDAVTITRARDIVFVDGYVGLAGASGIAVSDAQEVQIVRSVVSDVGQTGVSLTGQEGGSPARNAVIDSSISAVAQFTRAYPAAIRLTGVGHVVRGNRLMDLPQSAVIFNGQNHLILNNEIARATLETVDAGAIYSFGSLTTRGTVIAYNYFHDIVTVPELEFAPANLARSVYLDSWTSGQIVYGNLFERCSWPYWINSGEQNRIENNVFLNSGPSIGRFYDLTRHWQGELGSRIRKSLKSIDSRRAAELGIQSDSSLMKTGRGANNVVAGNILINSGTSIIDPALRPLQRLVPEHVIAEPGAETGQRIAQLRAGAIPFGATGRIALPKALRYGRLQYRGD